MLTYVEARNSIRNIARLFPTERIPLSRALNRVLADNIFADRDYPPFNRAAMDGIAIRIEDWDKGIRAFHIRETIFAGMETLSSLPEGACYKIMTGAACPPGTDTVVRKEDLEYTTDGIVRIRNESITIGQHIARKGEDLKKDSLAIAAPCVCDTALIGTLAALGMHDVPVYALPSVAIITTGNEVVDVGRQPNCFQIRNSNQYLLRALCEQWQLPALDCRHAADDPNALSIAFEEASGHQIILINGGVSAGDADYVPQVLQKMGMEIIFHKVLIKPGKPLLAGILPNGSVVFALPGNPLSCFVTFKLFVEEYLYSCLGFGKQRFIKAKLHTSRSKKSSLDEFFPVFRDSESDGYTWKLHHGSGDIMATIGCDGIGWHPHNKQEIPENDIIPVLPLQPFY